MTTTVKRLSAVLTLVVLAGCGGSTKTAALAPAATGIATVGASGVQSVTVIGNDALMFLPMTLQAKTGALQVVFKNEGSIAHTFRIKGLEPDTGNVNGHTTDTITVMLPHAGTYFFECDYHPTMVGTLDVS